MTSLRLALRGLAARLGLTLALLAVASFALAMAAAGAIYLRAAGESVLQDELRRAPPPVSGIGIEQRVGSRRELRRLDDAVRAGMTALPAFGAPVTELETSEPTRLGGHGPGLTAKLVSRSGLCDHLVVRAGRCPAATPLDLPVEVAVSTAVAARLHLDPGDRLRPDALFSGGRARRAVVVGVYRATPGDPWWWGHELWHDPRQDSDTADAPQDAVFLDAGALEAIVGGPADVVARWDLPLVPERVRLRDVVALDQSVSGLGAALVQAYPQAAMRTNLHGLLADADKGRQALTVPVLLVTVQLLALGLVILVVVAAMAAEARAGEVALAKIRGATTAQAFALATLELAIVALVALPAGLALGWLGTAMVARSQLVAGVPVVVTPVAVASTLLAALVALATAAAAGLGAVRRRVLDQWRQARSDRAGRRSLLAEVVLLTVAGAALFNLRLGGPTRAGSYDPLAVLAPALVVLAGALLVARLLPPVAGVLVRASVRSSRLGAFVGARQVARRGGAALRVVVALAAAFGLVTFALTVRQDLSRNRHDRAMTETGAARRAEVDLPTGSLGPELVRSVDPDGHAAMAVLRYAGSLPGSGQQATVLGVQADRYQDVGFWRRDFAGQPIGRLLEPLRHSPVPPLELGKASAIEVDLGVEDLRAAKPVTLVAEVRGVDGRAAAVRLGTLRSGRVRPYVASLDRLGVAAPYRLQRLLLDRGLARFFPVSATLEFDAVRVQQAGQWRVVEPFDDPARWYPLNQGDYEPADQLSAGTGGAGGTTVLAVQAPSTGAGIGLVHASTPKALPAVVTPGLLAAESSRVGQTVRVSSPTQGDVSLLVTGVAKVLPGTDGDRVAAMVDLDGLLAQAQRVPSAVVAADQVWATGDQAGDRALAGLRARGAALPSVTLASDREAALARQAPSLALLLLVMGAAAGAVLATGGVMLHLYLSGRRRGFELAVLEALGARRRDLWAPVVVEQGSLVGYGVGVGAAIGLAVALVALPAIPQFLDHPEVPPPLYAPDWPVLGAALGLTVLLVAGGLAVVVAALVRQARPELLREEAL